MSLFNVIEALVEERGLDKTVLSEIVCEGMLAAYQKKYPDFVLRATYDHKADAPLLEIEKTIVTSVEDDDLEISVRKAKSVDSKAKKGDKIWVPFDGTIGRIEVLRAKQLIATRIREIEAAAVYGEFKAKEGAILQGVIHKCERSGVVVKVQDYLAFLPKSLSIPGEKCIVSFP